MKFKHRCHSLFALVVTIYSVAAQGDGVGVDGVPLETIVFFFSLIIGLLVACVLYGNLMEKDGQLPPDEKYMTGWMQCWFWCCCLGFGLFCGLIFYLIASSEMNARLRRVTMQHEGARVPVQVVDGDQIGTEGEVQQVTVIQGAK